MNVESTGNSLISLSLYPSFKLIHLIKMCWPSGWQKNQAPLPNLFAHWFLTQNRGWIENPTLFLLHTQRLNSSDGLLSAVLCLNGALQCGQTPRYPIHWSILAAATHTYFCHTCAMKSIALLKLPKTPMNYPGNTLRWIIVLKVSFKVNMKSNWTLFTFLMQMFGLIMSDSSVHVILNEKSLSL